jgi:hypothetical protein
MSEPNPKSAGLCERCAHARLVQTPRSAFWLCDRAREDARLERYPRLPVRECHGYQPLPEGERPPGFGAGRPSRE